MKRNLLFAFQLLCALFALSACASPYPRYYSAEAIKIKVIDADTQQPLGGVVAVAHWPLLGGFEGNRPIAQMMVMETVSDTKGRLAFPAWGPLKRPMGYIRNEDPEMILFKPGYRYLRLTNQVEGSQAKVGESQRRSDWNGKTIALKPFKGTLMEYVQHFNDWNDELDQIVSSNPKECYWKKLPEAILGTERERKRILAQVHEQTGVDPHTVGSLYRDILRNDDWFTKNGGKECGSPKEFFLRYEL